MKKDILIKIANDIKEDNPNKKSIEVSKNILIPMT